MKKSLTLLTGIWIYTNCLSFDSHLGSGSNRIANYMNGNDFYDCEIDKEKFDKQEKRFELELMQPKLF